MSVPFCGFSNELKVCFVGGLSHGYVSSKLAPKIGAEMYLLSGCMCREWFGTFIQTFEILISRL